MAKRALLGPGTAQGIRGTIQSMINTKMLNVEEMKIVLNLVLPKFLMFRNEIGI